MELLSRLELPTLLITNEVLYRLSYSSAHTVSYYILPVMSTDLNAILVDMLCEIWDLIWF